MNKMTVLLKTEREAWGLWILSLVAVVMWGLDHAWVMNGLAIAIALELLYVFFNPKDTFHEILRSSGFFTIKGMWFDVPMWLGVSWLFHNGEMLRGLL
ncbi:hypothetical protein [Vibrio phage phiKT1028]|nr:hypothetical protein [Vibrio phage phiKT1028]